MSSAFPYFALPKHLYVLHRMPKNLSKIKKQDFTNYKKTMSLTLIIQIILKFKDDGVLTGRAIVTCNQIIQNK